MAVRKSDAFALFILMSLVMLALMFSHAALKGRASEGAFKEMRKMVRALGLTDLCIFTEARYTRHPAMADMNSAFQDHPLSLEHFPSGSLISPPTGLLRATARRDLAPLMRSREREGNRNTHLPY